MRHQVRKCVTECVTGSKSAQSTPSVLTWRKGMSAAPVSLARKSGAFGDAPLPEAPRQATNAEHAPLPWPSGVRDIDVVASCDFMVSKLLGVTVLEGDEASRAIELLRAFRKALTDNAVHARNWWRKYGRELRDSLRIALPDWYTLPTEEEEEEAMRLARASRVFEGRDLVRLTATVFPGARVGEAHSTPANLGASDE